jgi:hypothetical protein
LQIHAHVCGWVHVFAHTRSAEYSKAKALTSTSESEGPKKYTARTCISPDATMPQGEKGGGAGASGGDAAGGGGGKRRVCCARSGCGEDGQKRCGGCKQVGAE